MSTETPSAAAAVPIPPGRVATFAAGALPVGAIVTTLGVYLTNYYASHIGIPLAAVGVTFMLVRILDISVDPLLGVAMDWTQTPIGKYRPWLAMSAPILFLAVWMVYFPDKGVGTGYLIGWLLVMYLGYSMLTLSQAAWGAALVAEYHQRSRVYGWIQAVGVVGAVGVLLVPVLAATFWKSLPIRGVPLMGCFIFASIVVGALTTVFFAPEPEKAVLAKTERFGIKDYLALVVRPEMLRIMCADMFCTLGPAITAPLYLFFFEQARGYTLAQANVLLLFYIVAGLFAPSFWALVARRFGKHQTIRIASVCYVVAQSTLLALPRAHLFPMMGAMFTVGFVASAFGFLVRAMIADVSDEVRLETGKDRTGLLYALVTSTNKIGGTLSVGVAYAILPMFGFNPAEGAVNTPDAMWGLQACYLAPPVLCVLIGGLAMWGYKLDEKRHAEVRVALNASDAIAGARDALQSLTGEPPEPEQGVLSAGE
ncbi:MAG TPA: MFS transporter [Rhizomicrobium sp.]|nr:MFS transporter [Rhizomicrobium sp.]